MTTMNNSSSSNINGADSNNPPSLICSCGRVWPPTALYDLCVHLAFHHGKFLSIVPILTEFGERQKKRKRGSRHE